jgi:hypothetical protein
MKFDFTTGTCLPRAAQMVRHFLCVADGCICFVNSTDPGECGVFYDIHIFPPLFWGGVQA